MLNQSILIKVINQSSKFIINLIKIVEMILFVFHAIVDTHSPKNMLKTSAKHATKKPRSIRKTPKTTTRSIN